MLQSIDFFNAISPSFIYIKSKLIQEDKTCVFTF